ncbi:Uncharacterised protein [Vibrio cholerae]|nr:Uncharacterised protein [Vibrio cholerae]
MVQFKLRAPTSNKINPWVMNQLTRMGRFISMGQIFGRGVSGIAPIA